MKDLLGQPYGARSTYKVIIGTGVPKFDDEIQVTCMSRVKLVQH